MKITSSMTIDFPKLGFSIEKGEIKDLPDDKKAQEIILSNSYVSEVKKVESKK